MKAGIRKTHVELYCIANQKMEGEAMQVKRKDRHAHGYIDRYHTENYHQFYLRVRKDSGIMEALQKMQQDTGDSINGYVAESVKRRLILEGYMPEE